MTPSETSWLSSSASERNRCKANRCLGNNSVSWAESAIQKCVVYGEFIGKRNDSQEASLELVNDGPKPIAIALLMARHELAIGRLEYTSLWSNTAVSA